MYTCTTFKLKGSDIEIEFPFPVGGGANYHLNKQHVKFNFWTNAWSVVDKGISDDAIVIHGYDWDEGMTVVEVDCHPCYEEYKVQKNCMPVEFEFCFDELKQLFCFNPGICFKTICGDGMCFDPEVGIFSGGCFNGSNCFEGQDEFFCFGMCNTQVEIKYEKCKKVQYSAEFLQKFEDLNYLMDEHEQFTVDDLDECVNGVYVINTFDYNTVDKVPGLFEWTLRLKLVRKI